MAGSAEGLCPKHPERSFLVSSQREWMHEVCGAGKAGSELSQGFPSHVLVPAKHTGENSPGGKLKREFDKGHWVTGTVWVMEAGNLFLQEQGVC